VEALAAKKGCTPAQLSLAWLLAKAPDVIPIPGTKRVEVLEENVAAAGVVLSGEEVQELEAAVPAGAVAGDRWVRQCMALSRGGAAAVGARKGLEVNRLSKRPSQCACVSGLREEGVGGAC